MRIARIIGTSLLGLTIGAATVVATAAPAAADCVPATQGYSLCGIYNDPNDCHNAGVRDGYPFFDPCPYQRFDGPIVRYGFGLYERRTV